VAVDVFSLRAFALNRTHQDSARRTVESDATPLERHEMKDNKSGEDDFYVQRSSKAPWLLLILVLGGAGAAAYFGLRELESKDASIAIALKNSEDATGKARAAELAGKALEERLAKQEEEGARLAADRDSLARQIEQKESEIAKLKETYDSLQEKMKAEIKKGEIRLSQAGGRIRVDLIDKILFDSGSADLSKRGEEVLGRIGSVLAKVEDKQIQISGHTDDSPISDRLKEKFATNWELSVARAVTVVRFLSEHAKVPSGRMVAAGYGQFHPISSNANPEGRARNRRIEILLTPSLEARQKRPMVAKGPSTASTIRKAASKRKAPHSNPR
jgi:chemotaxis protein MotB